jgi:periplasmic protein CpxP/Spy
MKLHRASIRPSILAATLLLTYPLASVAAPAPGPDGDHGGRCGGPDFHGFRGPPPGPEMGPFPGAGFGAPPPFLRGLHLTDEQQDKVFAIVYAAAPAMRDQAKALRKAHEALHELNESGQYDENRVKGLADSAAKADSQLTVMRVRTDHEIYALLTPEQRKQLDEHRKQRDEHRDEKGFGDHGGAQPGRTPPG